MEPASDPRPARVAARVPLLPALLFFVSGFAGLTYEVLWQRELGLLFGSTTEATATTLAVFFLGLAVGSWLLGRRAARMVDPLRAFGLLEIGAGLGALLLPLLLPAYRALFGPLHAALGDMPAVFLAAKFLLSALVLAPSAILMGGTLPVLTEAAVRRGAGLARAGILLYAVNTAGAMAGAALAGFVLPRALGYRGAYLLAVGTSLTVGVIALLARRASGASRERPEPAPVVVERPLLVLAGLCGFIALALQVLWTRMVALAVVNSVYAFAAVLVMFLAALALGATGARALAARVRRPLLTLQVLLVLAALLTLVSGTLFRAVTGSPPSVGRGEDFVAYLVAIAGMLTVALLPAALAVGLLFPFLLRVEEARGTGAAGPRIGRLAAANTLGALLGSLAAGFLLPEALGLWASISVLAGLYGAALLLAPAAEDVGRLVALAGGALVLLLAVGHGLHDPEGGDRWDLRRDEKVLARYEGSAGTVRVVRRRGALKLRFNNSYTLGGTGSPRWEHYQAHIPLCLHPDPKRVFFLGMGTGITAGAALHHDVERVRVAEIVPEAVTAAREHFGPWLNGLFEDPRAEVVVADARTLLRGLDEKHDVIIGDLFLPWRPGSALLYSVEHFEAVRSRMAEGGVFAQWLPLYQLSRAEYDGIVASFMTVFGDATLWRGDFFGKRPIVALVAHAGRGPWDADATVAAWRRLDEKGAVRFGAAVETLPFLFYAGRVPRNAAGGRRITDDHPWLEFEAPMNQRARAAGMAGTFGGRALARYERSLLRRHPPAGDPWLTRLSEAQRGYILGGMALYESAALRRRSQAVRRAKAREAYRAAVPEALRPDRGRWTDD
ncbi:MAG: fused MFS/spermidine synthase [Planctomycetota bacterium]|nr:fused MFS/spermidine synthase [Planctomycetota bacterium]